MRWLLDTGVLIRLVNRSDIRHVDVVEAVRHLHQRSEELVVAVQNLVEFWNVSTRPIQARGGLGRNIAETKKCIQFFERLGSVLPETTAVYDEWKTLVSRHGIHGKAVHDARLVATMNVSGIAQILTLKPADFGRYTAIAVFTPADIVSHP